MGRTGSGETSSHPGMSLSVYVTSKWMPLRGSCTNGLKAYEQGQGWKQKFVNYQQMYGYYNQGPADATPKEREKGRERVQD